MARGSQKFTSVLHPPTPFIHPFLPLLWTRCRRLWDRTAASCMAIASCYILCAGIQIQVKTTREKKTIMSFFCFSYFAMIMTLLAWIMQCLLPSFFSSHPLFYLFILITRWFSRHYTSIMHRPRSSRSCKNAAVWDVPGHFCVMCQAWGFEYW